MASQIPTASRDMTMATTWTFASTRGTLTSLQLWAVSLLSMTSRSQGWRFETYKRTMTSGTCTFSPSAGCSTHRRIPPSHGTRLPVGEDSTGSSLVRWRKVGIHGAPGLTWGNVTPLPGNDNIGYCHHVLYPLSYLASAISRVIRGKKPRVWSLRLGWASLIDSHTLANLVQHSPVHCLTVAAQGPWQGPGRLPKDLEFLTGTGLLRLRSERACFLSALVAPRPRMCLALMAFKASRILFSVSLSTPSMDLYSPMPL